jgi:hypothetical protein
MVRKLAFMALLLASLGLRQSNVRACVDYFVCADGCSYTWQNCYINCGTCDDPNFCYPGSTDNCRDQCDDRYLTCEENCFENACS